MDVWRFVSCNEQVLPVSLIMCLVPSAEIGGLYFEFGTGKVTSAKEASPLKAVTLYFPPPPQVDFDRWPYGSFIFHLEFAVSGHHTTSLSGSPHMIKTLLQYCRHIGLLDSLPAPQVSGDTLELGLHRLAHENLTRGFSDSAELSHYHIVHRIVFALELFV